MIELNQILTMFNVLPSSKPSPHPVGTDDDASSLVYQIQHSIFANNGNFMDRTITTQTTDSVVLAATTNLLVYPSKQIRDTTNNNIQQQQQQQQHRPQQEQHHRLSTYDYLYLQWKEAIGNLSYKADNNESSVDAVSNDDDNNDTSLSYFDRWFQKLWNMHTNYTSRFYHTVVHLEEMCFYLQLVTTTKNMKPPNEPPFHGCNNDSTLTLTRTSQAKAEGNPSLLHDDEEVWIPLSIKSLLLFSIFFHDAIYNVHSSTNEEDSAILFEASFAKYTNLHPLQVQLVVAYILATKHHTIPETTTTYSTTSLVDHDHSLPYDPLSLFLDLDMSVLGKDSLAYHQYSILIRNEYSYVPADTYCHKRAEILEQFLTQSKQIYHTTIFYEAFETRARNNLRQEILLLRQGIIPA
jgi:predicted metal-dependent HD superfamily phosphohydrolase